jgi:hypothetical protein
MDLFAEHAGISTEQGKGGKGKHGKRDYANVKKRVRIALASTEAYTLLMEVCAMYEKDTLKGVGKKKTQTKKKIVSSGASGDDKKKSPPVKDVEALFALEVDGQLNVLNRLKNKEIAWKEVADEVAGWAGRSLLLGVFSRCMQFSGTGERVKEDERNLTWVQYKELCGRECEEVKVDAQAKALARLTKNKLGFSKKEGDFDDAEYADYVSKMYKNTKLPQTVRSWIDTCRLERALKKQNKDGKGDGGDSEVYDEVIKVDVVPKAPSMFKDIGLGPVIKFKVADMMITDMTKGMGRLMGCGPVVAMMLDVRGVAMDVGQFRKLVQISIGTTTKTSFSMLV